MKLLTVEIQSNLVPSHESIKLIKRKPVKLLQIKITCCDIYLDKMN
jgi:hypothetical protein